MNEKVKPEHHDVSSFEVSQSTDGETFNFNVKAKSAPQKPIALTFCFFLVAWMLIAIPLVLYALAGQGGTIAGQVIKAFFPALVVGFLIYKFGFPDRRTKPRDVFFSASKDNLLFEKFEGDKMTILPKQSIIRLVRRNSVGSQAVVEKSSGHYSGANPLIVGGATELLFGMRSNPGVVGGTLGGSTAVFNVIGGAVAGASAPIRNANERELANYRQVLAQNSYVLEVHYDKKKKHVLAGGLDEDTADQLLTAVATALEF